eukprot:11589698-Alexandrium_andersonii.AAC.1
MSRLATPGACSARHVSMRAHTQRLAAALPRLIPWHGPPARGWRPTTAAALARIRAASPAR